MTENKTDIVEIINSFGFASIKPIGNSMLPFIKEGRDTVILVEPKKQLKKYDMVVYNVVDNKLFMHRILKIRDNDLIIMGDNNTFKEYVNKSSVIAVCEGYYKNKKYIDCNKNKFYRIKVFLWCFCIPLRNFYLKCKRIIKIAIYKLFKIFFKKRKNREKKQ